MSDNQINKINENEIKEINEINEIIKNDNNKEENIKVLPIFAVNCIKNGKLEDAQKYCKIVLESEPENLEALYIMGLLYMKNNLYEESLEYFKRFIDIENDNPFVYEYMGMMDAKNRTEYFNKAIEINDNIRMSKKDYSRFVYIAFKTYQLEEYDISLNYANYIYNARQTNAIVNLLGCIYYQKGDYDKALSLFHDLNFTYEKKNIYILCNISSCYRKKNSMNMAIRYLEKAKELDGGNKLIYYNIGSIYLDLGDKKLSLENIGKALSIDGEYKEALELKEYINNLN